MSEPNSIRNSVMDGNNDINKTLIRPSSKKASFAEKWREKRRDIIQKTKIPEPK